MNAPLPLPLLRRIVIVGATSAIAEHCARHWVAEGPAEVTLIGRDATRLEALAADLQVRSAATQARVRTGDFLDPAFIGDSARQLAAEGPIDLVLIAHGQLPDQAAGQRDLPACNAALQINAVSPVLFAEAFAAVLEQASGGTLVIIGSVAGDRGRKSNYIYGAAKGLVERYAQGLQHRFAGSAVRVVLVKPGPTDTPMTAHLKQGGARLAPVDAVARQIVQEAARAQPVVYAPGLWRWIMLVVRLLPRPLFHRLNV